MLELDKIIFQTDTKQLEDALDKIEKLGAAVSELSKPLSNLEKETKKVVKVQSDKNKTTDEATEATTKNVTILEKQRKILEFMTQGMSKGQATVMAYADATGILEKEMKQLRTTLEAQRKLLGSEPFDKSLGAVKVLKNELGALREAQRQYNSGVELTTKQSKDLYREKFRLIEAMKIERDRARELGDSTTSESQRYAKLKQDLRNINAEYVALSKQRNKLADDESVTQTQRRINNLSRGLAPQISDVAVSLYGGMSPMTVLMQQGLQVRDLIQSSGVEANKLNEVLKKTGADFIGTIGGTFKAVGSLAVGVFQSAGENVVKFASDLLGITKVAELSENALKRLGASTEQVSSAMAMIRNVSSTVVGAGLAVIIPVVAAFAASLIALDKEQTQVAKSSTMFGASMGLTVESTRLLSKELGDLTGNTTKATQTVLAMAEAGGFTSDQIKLIGVAAMRLEKDVGVPVEDTIKVFKKLADEPSKALLEVAKSTGFVTTETMRMVIELEAAGKKSDAAALAQKAYADATKQAADTVKQNYGVLQILATTTGQFFSSMWDKIMGVGRTEGLDSRMNAVKQRIAEVSSNQGFLSFTLSDEGRAQMLKDLNAQLSNLEKQKKEIEDTGKLRAQQSENASILADTERLLGKELSDSAKYAAEISKLSAQQRKMDEAGLLTAKDKLAFDERRNKLYEDYVKSQKKDKPTKKKEKTEEERQLEAFIKLKGDLADQDRDLNKNYTENLAAIQAYAKTEEERVELIRFLLKQQPLYTKGEKERADALREGEKAAKENSIAFEKFIKSIEDTSKAGRDLENSQKDLNMSLQGQLEMLALESTLIGATEEERKRVIKTKEIELKLNKELLDISKSNADVPTKKAAEAEARQRYLDAMKGLNTEIANDASAKLLAAYRSIENELADSITTAFTKGLDEGFKSLGDMVSKEFSSQLKKDLDDLLKDSGAGKFVKDNIGYLNAAMTLFTKDAQGGRDYGKAAGQAIGYYIGGPLGSAIGGSIGKALGIVDYGGTYHTGGVGGYSSATGTKTGSTATGLRFGVDPKDYDTAATASAVSFSKAVVQSLDSTAEAFGKKTGYYVATAFADDISPDGAWGAMLIRLGDSLIADWGNNPNANGDANVPRIYADGEQGLTQYKADLAKSTLDTLKAMDLPEWVNNLLDSIGDTPTLDQLDEALVAIQQMPSVILTSIGTSAESLADIIYKGLEKSDPEGAGQAFADQITYGIEASLYQGFAQQITSIISTQLVTPVVTAMMAGSSITEAMANVSIDNMLKQAKAAAGALSAIISAPEFKDTLAELNSIIAGAVSGSMQGFTAPVAPAEYGKVEEVKAIKEATAEADKLKQSLDNLSEEKKKLSAELLALQGNTEQANAMLYELATEGMSSAEKQAYDLNQEIQKQISTLKERQGLDAQLNKLLLDTVALRKLELEKIDPSNQSLQQRIWLLEDEKAISEERKSLENQLLTVLEETGALRKLELETLDTSNRELQTRIWAIEDEKLATEKATAAAEKLAGVYKTLESTADSTADRFLSGDALKNYRLARIANQANEIRGAGTITAGSLDSLSIVQIQEEVLRLLTGSDTFEAKTALLDLAAQLIDLKKAASDAAAKTAKLAEEERKRVSDEQLGLQLRIAELNGDTNAIRAHELSLLTGDLNKALQQHIWLLEDQAAALEKSKTSTDNALAALERSVEAEKKVLQESITAKEESINNLKSVFDLLKNSSKDLLNEVDSTSKMLSSEARSYISGLGTSGDFDLEKLQDAISSAVTGVQDTLYVTKFDSDKDRLLLALDMRKAQDRAGRQLTIEERQLELLKSQFTALDTILQSAKEQLNAARGIDESIKSLAEAQRLFAEALLRETDLSTPATGSTASNPNSPEKLAVYATVLGYYSDAGGVVNPSIKEMYWNAAGLTGLPSFDVGTNYVPRDMIAQIHEGEAIVPRAYNPSANATVTDDKAANQIELLRYEVRAIATNTSKLERIIDRLVVVTDEGEALQTKAVV